MLPSSAKIDPNPQRTGEDYQATSPVVSEHLLCDCGGTGDTLMNPTGLLSCRGINTTWKNRGGLPEKMFWGQHLEGSKEFAHVPGRI